MKTFVIIFFSFLILVGAPLNANATFLDNFDSYTIGTWPTSWVADANALNAPNGVKADPLGSYAGDNALYLFGQSNWAPLAHHATAFEQNYDIAASMYFTDSVALGLADGFISLYSGPSWTTSGVHIFELQAGNAKVGTNIVKSEVSANVWHDIDIQFRRPTGDTYGSVSYYLDDEFLGTWSSSALSGAIWDQDYHYLSLVANNQGAGQYMYFDDVSVSSPSNNAVPEPATMMLFGIGLLGLAGISRRKK